MDRAGRREFLKRTGAAGVAAGLGRRADGASDPAAAAPGGKPSAARAPNILLILTDDQGWGDIHSHGNDKLDTPVMDRLAAEGARFDRFFVCPLCAPTRASVLTGRYHWRTGVDGVTHGKEIMRAEEVTIAEVLKAAGYATGCFGKWHNGSYFPHHPNGQGFEEFLGFCGGHWNNYFDTTLEHNGRCVQPRGYISDVLTDAAVEFIRRNKARPFFCYVPYNAPHSPFQVPDRYWDKYKGRIGDAATACAYAMVENLDDNLGRLLAAMDELGIARDTVVIFLTDNGPNGNRFNGDMTGRKGSNWEGGCRVPCFVRWPGRIAPGTTVRQIAAHVDLLPTIAAMCGVRDPKTLPLDGKDLLPLLTGAAEDWPDRMLFEKGAVRTQRWRLQVGGGKGAKKAGGAKGQLYDMVADPGQARDVAAEHAEVTERLAKAYDAWHAEAAKGLEGMPPPLPVGYAEAPAVTFLAPESKREGGVKFKQGNGWANDWLCNWTSPDDRVGWDIDVVRPGRFAVTLLYCCPAADVGAKVRVEAAGQTVEGTVSKAHDPSPLPSPDRVGRKEVYEKAWAELPLGTLELAKGRTQLAVRALSVPGKQVCELKAVRLDRQ